jgi:hypothetical protein
MATPYQPNKVLISKIKIRTGVAANNMMKVRVRDQASTARQPNKVILTFNKAIRVAIFDKFFVTKYLP